MLSPRRTSSKWNPWPVAITSFFAVAISSAVAFVVFCSFNDSDLVAQDYYEQELRYQAQMERLERARVLQNPASVAYDSDQRQITVNVPQGKSGAEVSATLTFYRPSAASLDRQISLDLDDSGMQVIDASNLAPGQWKLKLLWSFEGEQYLLEQNIVAASTVASGASLQPGS